MRSPINVVLRKSQVTGLLERICQQLELTDAQFETAKARYEAVGGWLAESDSPLLKNASIYPQGSISLQTTVKPLQQNEYDVDLVCYVPGMTPRTAPSELKRLIGDRLKANARYKPILEEKPRCWRINYANEFHLDITPAISNPQCIQHGVLVPDKHQNAWKESNPKGYKLRFDRRAELKPTLRLLEKAFAEARADVEALPEPSAFKGILRRAVQLCKRHRDQIFTGRNASLAPISIIITTVLAKSYEACVQENMYDTEIDVFLDAVRRMPEFIEVVGPPGHEQFFVWNESTHLENFAEKWNSDRRLADAFYRWQTSALADFERLSSLSGLDTVRSELGRSLGEQAVAKAMAASVGQVSTARVGGGLLLAPAVGLSTSAAYGTSVRPNTFFGAP